MIQTWAWGVVPTGFKRFSPYRRMAILVREGLEGCLDPRTGLAQIAGGMAATAFHGRGNLRFIPLENGDTALIRAYRHGGVFRPLTRDFFFTWPPRPFKELVLTAEVYRRGVRTLEVLGAWVERIWGPFYRGWLITRELKGAQDLWDVLQRDLYSEDDRKPLLRAVAQSIRCLHRHGVYHRDLNLKNILVRQGTKGIETYIIDFDKAKLFYGEVPAKMARKNIRRLLRSVCKLDPYRQRLTPESWDLLIRFYQEAAAG